MTKLILIPILLLMCYIPQNTYLNANSTIIAGEPNIVEPEPYRLTHYYTNDNTGSGKCTASGLCTDKFQVNDKGWYTYKGKLVLASATNSYIKKSKYGYQSGIIYRDLWDEVEIQIDGVWYKGLIADVCGRCMIDKKIDIFVSGKESAIDRKVVYVK